MIHLRHLMWSVLFAVCMAMGSVLLRLLSGLDIGAEVFGDRYRLQAPRMLALFSLVPLLVWGLTHSLADLPLPQRALSFLVRALLIGLLVLALAQPVRITDATRISAVFLVDVSDSVADAGIDRARTIMEEARQKRRDNDLRLVTFAARPREVPFDSKGKTPPVIERHKGQTAGAETDIQAAVQLAYGLFPADHLRRLVIISDGNQTRGDLLAEATRAKRFGVPISVYPLLEDKPSEVAIRELRVPDEIEVGKPFHVNVRIFSTVAAGATVRLYQDEILNGLDGVRRAQLAPGETEIRFDSVVHIPGKVNYRVELVPAQDDRFTENNHFTTTVEVAGRPRVLYVEDDLSRARYLERALSAAEYAVDVRGPRAIPRDLRELDQYDFFILSDVSAEALSVQQMVLIERYVRDLGGGFLMAGGENGFGLGGYQGTRLEKLLPVRMETRRRRDEHSLAMALIIDRSGSMTGQKIELAKEAAKATAELLGPDDYVEVIGFSGAPDRIVRMQSARNRVKIIDHIGRLKAQGGTAILPALDMAFQDLSVTRARIKHGILLTDGRTEESGIEQLVQSMHAEGITLSTVGLGGDVNRTLLLNAANLGKGRAYFTHDPHSIPRIFVRETSVVARSSAVEEFFRPAVTERADFLRGIGIENAPFLHGYVATEAKNKPAQVILQSEYGEPILARWRVGLGWTLAWTSDTKNRWAVQWVKWRDFSRFWGQLIREHMRQRRGDTFDMQTGFDGDRVVAVIDAIGRDDRFLNDLRSKLVLEGPMEPAGRSDRFETEHELLQTAPGLYEASFPLHRYGSFILRATLRSGEREIGTSRARLANPFPREYALIESNEKLLRQAARLTSGKTRPGLDRIFDPGKETVLRHKPLWSFFVFTALGLFLLDLLLRRVRIFDRGFTR